MSWGQMQVGQSVFIPCFNTFEAGRQVRHIAKRHGYHVRIVPRIEGGYRGLRVWRMR